jgi:hypothetical protein
MDSVLTKSQYKHFGPRPIDGYGPRAALWATVRFDDECGNGHNTFAITGQVRVPRRKESVAWGCLHDEIAKVFPELAPLIKWHLCSTDGPLHYIQNTVFLAGDKDCWGRRAGEPSAWDHGIRFGDSPVTHYIPGAFWSWLQERQGTGHFQVTSIAHGRDERTYAPHYTFVGFGEKWHECPFRHQQQADEFCEGMNRCKVEFVKVPTEFSAGKERELDAARRCAIWPDATDEDLTAPGLEERLRARLPALLTEFRLAVESLGLGW